MELRARLAGADGARRAAQGRRDSAARPILAAAMQRCLGSAMAAIGCRLRGAEPVGDTGAVTAGGSAVS